MTNPIPGVDSELPPLPKKVRLGVDFAGCVITGYDEATVTAYARAAVVADRAHRAAAKVGANVAADCATCHGSGVVGTPGAKCPFCSLATIAAGAPAETPKPRPELTVVYCSMPESNGKANWTATLSRKGDTGFDAWVNGVTFSRSEYPDRVRYEADCMRFLIGELETEPFILDYDSEKHSGYVKPAAQPTTAPIAGDVEKDAAPEIDYDVLIAAAEKLGHRQGTRRCVAFKHGAEWFRAAMLANSSSGEAG